MTTPLSGKKLLSSISIIVALMQLTYGQNKHENTWYFGRGHSVNFSSGSPVAGGIPVPMDQLMGAHTAASDDQGNLLFFLKIIGATNSYTYNQRKIFDRSGNPFPNGNIETNMDLGGNGYVGTPIIVAYPGQNDKYLIFYSHKQGLLYSVVDMKLNNGLGAIDPGFKDRVICPYNTIIPSKMTTIQGCDAVWLVIRSRLDNQYLSFKINETGVNPVPIVSMVGLLDPQDYLISKSYNYRSQLLGSPGPGLLQSSNTHRWIAAGTNKGVELYDFEPCSGKLVHPRVIDTQSVFGVCFSPDDTKLYTTQNYSWPKHGKVFQYDLNQASSTAIGASKTLLIHNPLIIWDNQEVTSGYLGDLKLGIDGKIYIANNTEWVEGYLYNPAPYPPSTQLYPYQALHVIHQPNQAGLSCQPELCGIRLEGPPHIQSGLYLPKKFTNMPATLPDTLPGAASGITVCFQNATVLQAPEFKSCYLWDDDSTLPQREVKASGTYWVRYFEGCSITTDTFRVQFIELPEIPEVVYGCPGWIELNLPESANTGTSFSYSLYQGDSMVATGQKVSPAFQHLNEGMYQLLIQSPEGCDTMIDIHLETYPVPVVRVLPLDTVVRYGDRIQLEAHGGQRYSWWPPGLLEEPHSATPRHQAFQPVTLGVRGNNEYGCWDTAYVQIRIDYTLPDMMPNAFSPNGDGHNDIFRVAGLTYQQVLYFRVYNRWGQEVYAGFNNEAGWDGTYKGQACDAGTYYYQVALAYPDGQTKVLKGDLLLLR